MKTYMEARSTTSMKKGWLCRFMQDVELKSKVEKCIQGLEKDLGTLKSRVLEQAV